MMDDLPKALLTASLLEGLQGEAGREKALAHLREARQIAERGPMPLLLADVHLHRARLFASAKDEGRRTKWGDIDPRAELAEARRLIEAHHYGRRREELADAELALDSPRG
jgi:hypothetical protein